MKEFSDVVKMHSKSCFITFCFVDYSKKTFKLNVNLDRIKLKPLNSSLTDDDYWGSIHIPLYNALSSINQSIDRVVSANINDIMLGKIKGKDSFYGIITDNYLVCKISQNLVPIDILGELDYRAIDLCDAISFEMNN